MGNLKNEPGRIESGLPSDTSITTLSLHGVFCDANADVSDSESMRHGERDGEFGERAGRRIEQAFVLIVCASQLASKARQPIGDVPTQVQSAGNQDPPPGAHRRQKRAGLAELSG